MKCVELSPVNSWIDSYKLHRHQMISWQWQQILGLGTACQLCSYGSVLCVLILTSKSSSYIPNPYASRKMSIYYLHTKSAQYYTNDGNFANSNKRFSSQPIKRDITLKCCLQELDKKNVKFRSLTTDRHPQVEDEMIKQSTLLTILIQMALEVERGAFLQNRAISGYFKNSRTGPGWIFAFR